MTWREWNLARQLLAEETVGVTARDARRREDEAWERGSRALERLK